LGTPRPAWVFNDESAERQFQMPGSGHAPFVRRSIEVAKAAVYNLRIGDDRVLLPLIKDWNITALTGLKPAVAEV